MSAWFFLSFLGMVGILPLYFRSLEHQKLENKFGKEQGKRRGTIYGMISGWGFFLFWFGLWITPQDRFSFSFSDISFILPLFNLKTSLFHSIMFIIFLVPALIFGIGGVMGTGLETSETHRAEKLETEGLYSIIRHPQYFGGILGHVSFTFLFSAFLSLLLFPIILFMVFLISKKEEIELLKEFGEEYENYMKNVPMLIPFLKKGNGD